MSYQARLDVDLTFHTPDAIDTALAEAGEPSGLRQAHRQASSGWPILAQLGEYAHADLGGLHLTGWIRGHLLSDFDARLRALARHADGTIGGVGEDGSSWLTRLAHGHVTNDHVEPARAKRSALSPGDAQPTGEPRRGTGDRPARVGRIELHVTHGLAPVAAVPWIAAHIEELHFSGPQAGSITLTGVTTFDAESLRAAAPDAIWQAFCNADTTTPGRWIGYHPAIGIVEAHHVDGLLVVPRRGIALGAPGHDDHLARLTQLLRLLDTPLSGTRTESGVPTPAQVTDPLAHIPGGPTVLDPHAGPARTHTRSMPAR